MSLIIGGAVDVQSCSGRCCLAISAAQIIEVCRTSPSFVLL